MQETWRAFAGGMAGKVTAAFGDGRSPLEIAYAIGELVHNCFRTRGLTLTSYELRRLVAELLARRQRRCRSPTSGPLVQFASEPSSRPAPWTDAAAPPPPAVADAVFAGPPLPLVSVAPREVDEVVAKVRARLTGEPFGLPRQVVIDAIAWRMADLLRIAARSRLNMLVVGLEKSGKTALLAALARDLGDVRVVTLASHRTFG